MRKFTDRSGREWALKITWGEIERVKADGHDLMSLEEGRAEKLKALASNPLDLLLWIWLFIRPQAVQAGVGKDDFYDAMIGESFTAGRRAFLELYSDFSPVQAIRSLLKEQLDLEDKAEEEMTRATKTLIDKARKRFRGQVGTISDENISREFDRTLAEMESKLASSPSIPPALSELSCVSPATSG